MFWPAGGSGQSSLTWAEWLYGLHSQFDAGQGREWVAPLQPASRCRSSRGVGWQSVRPRVPGPMLSSCRPD